MRLFSMFATSVTPLLGGLASALVLGSSALAQCPEETPLQNGQGGGSVTCPCFVTGEEAGAVFNLPASAFPIEIVAIQVGWGSQFGGTGNSLEQAIHIYPAGLPNPGTPQFSLVGPQLTDGFINEFTLPIPEQVNAGPFSVTLELANNSSIFAAAPVHDGNGCTPGQNLVKDNFGNWNNACGLGVTGDWIFNVRYRPANCGGPEKYCVGKFSSSFCLASITTTDINAAPVSGASDYSIQTFGMQGFRNGIFFFGFSGKIDVPFQGGTLCVSPPLGRGPIINSLGTSPNSCDGTFDLLLNDGVSLWDPGAGMTLWSQTWYRDPPVDVFGTALSDAIEITFQ